MKKFLIGIFAALLTVAVAFAEVDIPVDKRVKNFPSGCCVWCSLENLANVHNIEQLKGIAKYRHENFSQKKIWVNASYVLTGFGMTQIEGPHWSTTNEAPGTESRVTEELDKRKVKYKMQKEGNFDTAILEESAKSNLGCAVGLHDYPEQGDYHMVTLVDINNENVKFVDNNGSCLRYKAPRSWFNEHWMGYTVLLYPNEKEEKPAK